METQTKTAENRTATEGIFCEGCDFCNGIAKTDGQTSLEGKEGSRSIAEWKEIIARCDDRSLMEREVALHTLNGWLGFDNSFGWTGMKLLQTLIREELNKRGREWGFIQMQINPAYQKEESQ